MKIFTIICVFLITLNTIDSLKVISVDGILPSKDLHNDLMDMLVQVQTTQEVVRSPAEFTEKIEKMLRKLQETQKQHREINQRMRKQCLEEENFRLKEIADATSAYNAAANQFAKCQKSFQAAQENEPNLKKAKREFEAELALKQKQRNHQHALYLRRRNDWKEAIAFLDEFIKEVKNKLSKGNHHVFAQMTEKLLKHVSNCGKMAQAMEVFVALAQAPSEFVKGPGKLNNYKHKSNDKVIARLINHLQKLRNVLYTDSVTNDRNENKAQRAFDIVKSKLTKTISILKEDIEKTSTQITNMRACKTKEESVMTIAGGKLRRNQGLAHAAIRTCTDFAREFIEATENRDKEIDVIYQILGIIKKRFGQISPEFLNYLDHVKGQFSEYRKSSEYKAIKNYLHTRRALRRRKSHH